MDKKYDLAVIGGGPAGIAATIYARRAGKSVLLFEGGETGGTLRSVEKIENYPGFPSISGAELADKMTEQMMKFSPDIVRRYAVRVAEENGCRAIYTGTDVYYADNVIFCGGTPRVKPAAATAFRGAGVSYCAVCDGFFFRGKTVVVSGSGAEAREDVEYLLGLCEKVYYVGKTPIDGAENLGSEIVEILGDERVVGVKLKDGREIAADGVFYAAADSPEQILEGATAKGGVVLNDGGKIFDGLYVAGDASGGFKQVVWACASGAKAATEIFRKKQ